MATATIDQVAVHVPETRSGIRPVALPIWAAAVAVVAVNWPGVALFAAGAAVVIGTHEIAHAIVAHRRGRQVHEITIGFFPKTRPLAWTEIGGVRYTLKPIPFGGYCYFDEKNLSGRDEIATAAAGPLWSLISGLGLLIGWMFHTGTTNPVGTGLDVFWQLVLLDISHPELAVTNLTGQFIVVTIVLSVTAGATNLLPLLPFDGGRIVNGFLKSKGTELSQTVLKNWTRLGTVMYFLLVVLCTIRSS